MKTTHIVSVLAVCLGLVICRCVAVYGAVPTATQPYNKKSKIATARSRTSQKHKIKDSTARDKALYYDATLMLGGVSAMAQATGRDPSELARINGIQFDKQHRVSDREMERITKEGEKENWPDGYEEGAALERSKLRRQGYKFPGDL